MGRVSIPWASTNLASRRVVGYFRAFFRFIALAHATTPFVSAYPWSSSGFGAKFANPATLPTGVGRGVAFHKI